MTMTEYWIRRLIFKLFLCCEKKLTVNLAKVENIKEHMRMRNHQQKFSEDIYDFTNIFVSRRVNTAVLASANQTAKKKPSGKCNSSK